MQSQIYGNRGLNVSGGRGAILFDQTGREYIDFFAGHGASLFGHSNPDLVSALKEAAGKPWNTGSGLICELREAATVALVSHLPGYRAFWTNSGTEAIEGALKLCALNRPERSRILALRRGFHGRSTGALSLTFNPKYRKPFAPFLFDTEFFEPEEIADAVDETTLAVFVEPVQGEGGVYVTREEIGRRLTAQCRHTGALLVADEIQSGFGRCGAFLASEKTGLDPDIVCLSKGVAGGLPVGVILWREDLADFPPMSHGSTTGGNPLVCSVALAATRLLEKNNYPVLADSRGAAFRQLLEDIESPLISEVRGMGLLVGVQLQVKSYPVIRSLQEKGLLALPAGPSVVRFLPPFTAEMNHFEKAAAIFAEVLETHGSNL